MAAKANSVGRLTILKDAALQQQQLDKKRKKK
jgi:hypothetical protein